jgi:hypothetical protein
VSVLPTPTSVERLRDVAAWALSWDYLFGWSPDITLGPPVPKPIDFTEHVHRLATAVIDTLPLHAVAVAADDLHDQVCGCGGVAGEPWCELGEALARLERGGEEAIAA